MPLDRLLRKLMSKPDLPVMNVTSCLPWSAPAGNSPTLMSMEDMRRVMPVWFNMSIAVHMDDEARGEWDWVQVN